MVRTTCFPGGWPHVVGSAQGGDSNRLLITGAAGNMGRLLRPLLRREDRILRLGDIVDIDDVQTHEEVMNLDVLDPEAVTKACQDVDAVFHLGGISAEASFDDVLQVNVVGTHNVLRAAVDAGVPKVILASSNHAVGFYRRSDVSEGSGGLYHSRFGIDITVLRIGTCFAGPADTRALSTWLAPSDAARLVEACLAFPDKGFRVVWAVSDNTRRWWSLAGARALGYDPTDDAERFAPELIARFGDPDLTDPVHDLVGGGFCVAPLGEPMT